MSHRILVILFALFFVFAGSSYAFAGTKPHIKKKPVKKLTQKKERKRHHHHTKLR
jgi:hypothetical protein